MIHFLICFIAGVVTTGIIWWRHKCNKNTRYSSNSSITKKELAASIGINSAIALFSLLLFFTYGITKALDIEVLNGKVTKKYSERVSCSHSYSCPPCWETCSGEGANRSCTETCSTCYDHDYDVNWNVNTTVGNLEINRIDRQGVRQPPRWTAVQIGEHASRERYYQNYLLISNNNYFTYNYEHLLEKYKDKLIAYPEVYDYYRYNRVINLTSANTSWLNDHLNNWIKDAGYRKQLNIIYILTYNSADYFDAIMTHWKGGKKNDLIIVHGLEKSTNKVLWTNANTYARGLNNQYLIKDIASMSLEKEINVDLINAHLQSVEKNFRRLEASQFESEKKNVKIPILFTIFILLLNIAASYGVSVYMRRVNI